MTRVAEIVFAVLAVSSAFLVPLFDPVHQVEIVGQADLRVEVSLVDEQAEIVGKVDMEVEVLHVVLAAAFVSTIASLALVFVATISGLVLVLTPIVLFVPLTPFVFSVLDLAEYQHCSEMAVEFWVVDAHSVLYVYQFYFFPQRKLHN